MVNPKATVKAQLTKDKEDTRTQAMDPAATKTWNQTEKLSKQNPTGLIKLGSRYAVLRDMNEFESQEKTMETEVNQDDATQMETQSYR